MTIQVAREEDGRWIAEVLELPGALVYGSEPEEAAARVKSLAVWIIDDRLEHGEAISPAGL